MITSAASPAAIHTNSEISTFDICCSEISVFILITSGSTLSEEWSQALSYSKNLICPRFF